MEKKIKTILPIMLMTLLFNSIYMHFLLNKNISMKILAILFIISVSILASKYIFKSINRNEAEFSLKRCIYIGVASFFLSLVLIISIPILPGQKINLEITVIGDKNVNSKGTEVWVPRINIDGNKLNENQLKLTKNWRIIDSTPESSEKNSSLVWKGIVNKEVKIEFISHAWSGKVLVSFNGKNQLIDLYAEESTTVESQYNVKSITFQEMFLMFTDFFNLSVIFYVILLLLLRNPLLCNYPTINKISIFYFSAPVFIICIIYQLSFYPGVMTTDSFNQWYQVSTGRFYDGVPLFHTLFIWLFTRIWFSPAIIIFIHIMFISITVGYSAYTFGKMGVKRFYLWLFVFWYALNPTIGIMSISLWKDIPFATSQLLLTVLMLLIYKSNYKWLYYRRNQVLFTAVIIFVGLFRHNGITAVMGTLLALVFFYRKYLLRTLKLFGIAFVLMFLIKVPLYNILNVAPIPSFLGVSFQIHQVGTMVHDRAKIKEDEKQFISKILPLEEWDGGEKYTKYSGDFLVWNKKFNVEEFDKNKSEFLKLWSSLVIRNPQIAITDWISMSSIIWRMHQPADGYTYASQTTIQENEFGITQDSKLPRMKDRLTKIFDYTNAKENIWLFWRPALYIFLILLFGIIFILRNGYKAVLILIPILFEGLGLIIVILAQDARYFFSALLIAPLIVLVSFVNIQKNIQKN